MKLKVGIKRKWLKALRKPAGEGGYLQTKGVLCATEDGEDYFCCLGVLTNITEGFYLDGTELNKEKHARPSDGWPTARLLGIAFKNIGEDIDLDDQDSWAKVEVKHEGQYYTLDYLNDTTGLSFLQIADLIEAQL